jgi:C4-type Zn-finger protein
MKLLTFLVLFFVAVSSASAQNICAKREEVVQRLWERWQETLTANGLANDNRLIEVFVSKKGSWTVIISDPSGRSCVASAGQGWTLHEPKNPAKDMRWLQNP